MRFMAAATVAAFVSTALGHAATIDLSARTCQQFLTSGDEEIKLILTWLDGYYLEESAPPVIDTERLIENAKKLGEFCRVNPDMGLITAADELFK